MPVGMLTSAMSRVGHAFEVLEQGSQAVAVRDDQHLQPGPQVGDDRVVPVGEHPHDHVGQALGRGEDVGREPGVALVVAGMLG